MGTPDTFWDLCLGYTVLWLLIVFYLVRLQAAQRAVASRLLQIETRTGSISS